jgi:hypothetical protein
MGPLESFRIKLGARLVIFFDELFIPLKLICVNRRVAAQEIDTKYLEVLTHDELRNFIKEEWSRAKDLEEKLQKLTAVLSVSVTVSGLVGATMIQKLPSLTMKYFTGGFMFLATFYLIVGVLIGFSGFVPKLRYGYGAKFLHSSKGRSPKAKIVLVDAAASFERDNIVRSNKTYAAAASIRNGLMAFVLALLISSLAWVAASTQKDVNDLTTITVLRTPIEYPPYFFPSSIVGVKDTVAERILQRRKLR